MFLAFGGFPLFCWVSKPLTCATCADRAAVGSMATQIVTTMNANTPLAPQVPESLVQTEHPTPPADAADAAAPPPAAKTVLEGAKTEREIELERIVETERRRADVSEARAKKAETDASYNADETRRLREAQGAPPPKAKVIRAGVGWFPEEREEA